MSRWRIEPIAVRFARYTDVNGPIPTHAQELGACWVWTGSKTLYGYGNLYDNEKKHVVLAHRWAYENANGDGSAAGLFVCHKCDNPSCVRPSHLFLGTPKDNQDDMKRKGRDRFTGAYNPRRGERCHNAKLTSEDVRWMRWARDYSGASFKDIGLAMGLATNTVHKAIVGKTWA